MVCLGAFSTAACVCVARSLLFLPKKIKKCYFRIENNFHTDCRPHYTRTVVVSERERVRVRVCVGCAWACVYLYPCDLHYICFVKSVQSKFIFVLKCFNWTTHHIQVRQSHTPYGQCFIIYIVIFRAQNRCSFLFNFHFFVCSVVLRPDTNHTDQKKKTHFFSEITF